MQRKVYMMLSAIMIFLLINGIKRIFTYKNADRVKNDNADRVKKNSHGLAFWKKQTMIPLDKTYMEM